MTAILPQKTDREEPATLAPDTRFIDKPRRPDSQTLIDNHDGAPAMQGPGIEIAVRAEDMILRPSLPLLIELANSGFDLGATFDNPALGRRSVGYPIFDRTKEGSATAFRVKGAQRPAGVADLVLHRSKGSYEVQVLLEEPVSRNTIFSAAEAIELSLKGRKTLEGLVNGERAVIVDRQTDRGHYGRIRLFTAPIWEGAPKVRAPFRRGMSLASHLLDPQGIPESQAKMPLLTLERVQAEMTEPEPQRYDVKAMDRRFLERTHQAQLLGPFLTTFYHLFNQPVRSEAMVTSSIPGRRNAVRADKWFKTHQSQYDDGKLWTLWAKGLPGVTKLYTLANGEEADGIVRIGFDRPVPKGLVRERASQIARGYGVEARVAHKGPYLNISIGDDVVLRTPKNQTSYRNWHLLPARDGDAVLPSRAGVDLIEALYSDGIRGAIRDELLGGIRIEPKAEQKQYEMLVTAEVAESLERYREKRREAYKPSTISTLSEILPGALNVG